MSQEAQGLLSPYLRKQRYIHATRHIKSHDVVLDIGCGNGGLKQYLPSSAKYFGVDVMKWWSSSTHNLYVSTVGDEYPKTITKQKYDVITALAVIEHLKKPGQLFADASKLLKPGGRLIITTPHPLGRSVHDLGAKIGIFSSDASEEHEKFLSRSDMEKLSRKHRLSIVLFNRFLLGMNQVGVFVLEK